MFKIFRYYTILIQESMLSFCKGNPVLFLILKIVSLIPFKI